jgi:hypothetical protein
MNLHSELANTRITRTGDITEVAAGEVANRVVKLRVIKNVKEFSPDVHRDALPNVDILKERHIPVVQARTMKEPPVGVTGNT